ncbi:hypothetical protein [Cysteiniphilum marinum]|uniref:hypothetical protein n=1 Tax=Cysteiniphilum marinum TaxID=2774191 RepID=UPI00193BC7FE|nr:hypothetical protein [Cysteiniphilum marinum]
MTVKLNYATIETVNALIDQGLERNTAETLVQTLSNQEHDNVYSVKEIDSMLSEAVRDVFKEFDGFRKEMRQEAKTDRRWLIGTIVTVGAAIFGINFTLLMYVATHLPS